LGGPETRGIVYRALPSQRRFHESAARFKGFSGPIGSGKSQALCQEAIKLSYLNPGRTGLIGAPTYPMLRDATVAGLIDVLGRNRIPHEVNRAENYLVMGDATTAWMKEARSAQGRGFESVVLFALDQMCLIGYALPLPEMFRRSVRMGS
jgi:hypothetical protein